MSRNDGKHVERLSILTAKFIQLQAIPPTPLEPPALLALDEKGRVWDYNFEHKVWAMMSQNRALPE